jgi:hypothetical protein
VLWEATPSDWDAKYLVCRNVGTAEPECTYDYCDPYSIVKDICLASNFTKFVMDFGRDGQDCDSFSIVEGYAMDGDVPHDSYFTEWCNKMTFRSPKNSSECGLAKDWDLKYYIDPETGYRGANYANTGRLDKLDPSAFDYCDPSLPDYSTLCAVDDRVRLIKNGGVVGQDCGTFRMVEDYVFNWGREVSPDYISLLCTRGQSLDL